MRTARVFETVAESVADCSLVVGLTAAQRRELQQPIARLADGIPQVREHGGRVALMFGSEKTGLSNEDMSYCQWLLRIPSREEHGSMNLGQAVAICLYELRRDAAAAAQRLEEVPPASAEDFERITALLLDLLDRSGYLNPSTAESSELKLRRLVRRLGLPASDAVTWLGIFRQILWKIGKTPSA